MAYKCVELTGLTSGRGIPNNLGSRYGYCEVVLTHSRFPPSFPGGTAFPSAPLWLYYDVKVRHERRSKQTHTKRPRFMLRIGDALDIWRAWSDCGDCPGTHHLAPALHRKHRNNALRGSKPGPARGSACLFVCLFVWCSESATKCRRSASTSARAPCCLSCGTSTRASCTPVRTTRSSPSRWRPAACVYVSVRVRLRAPALVCVCV